MRTTCFNQNWIFYKENNGEAVTADDAGREPASSSRDEKKVNLPYDAMIHEQRCPSMKAGETSGYYPGGKYAYVKYFKTPAEWAGQAVLAEFEGVYGLTTVSLNGQTVGTHANGFTGFYCDLTDALKPADSMQKGSGSRRMVYTGCPEASLHDVNNTVFSDSSRGSTNVLKVTVDNTRTPGCRWYTGSGIYRDVVLHIGNPIHFTPDSVSVETLQINPVKVRIRYELSGKTEGMTVQASVYDSTGAAGKELAGCAVPAGQPLEFEIPDADPWSDEHPVLYHIMLTLLQADPGQHKSDESQGSEGQTPESEDNISNKTVMGSSTGSTCGTDLVEFDTGFRTLSWNTGDGFLSNGTRLKLRGACIHPDNGPLGAVELDAAEERRIQLLKDCGYNAIRCSHSPASKAVLRACDRLGMYVMDEFSDVWRGQKNDYDYALLFDQNWKQDVDSMVLKDRSHPSVVIYSTGNEVYDISFQEGAETGKKIADRIRLLDPTRPVTNAINVLAAMSKPKASPIPAPKTSMQDIVDPLRKGTEAPLVGSRLMNTLSTLLPGLQKMVSAKKLLSNLSDFIAPLDVIGLNYGTHMPGQLRSAGIRQLTVHSETYPSKIGKTWQDTEKDPMVLGDFMWTGWDYIGEAGLGVPQYGKGGFAISKPYPCLTGGVGSIDLAGFITAQGAYAAAVFGKLSRPYLAVHPVEHSGEKVRLGSWRATDAVHSWSFPGYEGRAALIDVYAGEPAVTVRLYRNGVLIGEKRLRECQASFRTTYLPGTIEAAAFDRNGKECGRDFLATAGAEKRLHVSCSRTCLAPDGRDAAFLSITAEDRNGNVRYFDRSEVRVTVTGAGYLAGMASGNPMQEDAMDSGRCRLYQGHLTAVIRSGYEPGEIRAVVSAEDYPDSVATLTVSSTA